MANHINPKVRAYGKARLDFTLRAKNEAEWMQGWHDALYEFPFRLSNGWRFGFEYKVDDYAAEIGFFVDQLGFPVVSFSPSYAQFTTPEQNFIFSIAHALEGEISTPPETVRLHMQVLDLEDTVQELQSRGIDFEQEPYLLESSSSMVASFRSPHGISIDLWQSVDHREEEVAEDGWDEEGLYQDQDAEGHIRSRYDREIVVEDVDSDVDADDDPEFQEEPIDERFEESKRHNYRLWDEDEENHDDFEDDEPDNEVGQPLILNTSADKDDFLDTLLKETSDRKAESEIQEVNPVQEQEKAGESRKNNRLAKTRSVLHGLRANHNKTSRVLQSDVKISSGRATYGNRLKNMNDDDQYEDEAFSGEELVYQEIDDGDEDYPG
jgi:hypothetical protein